MRREQIEEPFLKFEQACYLFEGIECWIARELLEILNYTQWRNFKNAIEKAKKACENACENVSDHFADVNKMVDLGSGAQRHVDDLALTRYACYLIAQNGESAKPEIAFAQTFFAFQSQISSEHIENNKAVRKMLIERGVKPEQLPPSEDVKKVQCRLESDERKILKEVQKKKSKKK